MSSKKSKFKSVESRLDCRLQSLVLKELSLYQEPKITQNGNSTKIWGERGGGCKIKKRAIFNVMNKKRFKKLKINLKYFKICLCVHVL